MAEPPVRWFQHVLHNQPGFDEVRRVGDNHGDHARETSGHNGAPLGNAAQVVHEQHNKPGGKQRKLKI